MGRSSLRVIEVPEYVEMVRTHGGHHPPPDLRSGWNDSVVVTRPGNPSEGPLERARLRGGERREPGIGVEPGELPEGHEDRVRRLRRGVDACGERGAESRPAGARHHATIAHAGAHGGGRPEQRCGRRGELMQQRLVSPHGSEEALECAPAIGGEIRKELAEELIEESRAHAEAAVDLRHRRHP